MLRVPPADPATATAHFARRLAVETDVSDVHAALESGRPGFVLVDTRSDAAREQGHIPGSLHLPTAAVAARARHDLDRAVPVVVHCWGPGCNGATRAALALALLGYPVKEMIGGYEYWVREGFAVRVGGEVRRPPVDPLTAPSRAAACGC